MIKGEASVVELWDIMALGVTVGSDGGWVVRDSR